MSKSEQNRGPARKAVALQYGTNNSAPVIVASGMGYLAEKIVEVASDNGVPVYEDNSLATILTQLRLGQEIPPELYKAIVDIYVYFLHFDPDHPDRSAVTQTAEPQVPAPPAETAANTEEEVSTDATADTKQ